jgi:endonuclease YncB( thermonuclease family)
VSHGGSRSDNFDDLDEDGDGIACESLACPCSTTSAGGHKAPTPTVPPGERLRAYVVCDVDGDTIYVRFRNGAEGYVRLIGIDTPEEVKPNYPVECESRAAARSMTAMAARRRATLSLIPPRIASIGTDGSSPTSKLAAST